MILAEGFVVVWVGVVLVAGFLGFFVVLLATVGRVFQYVFRVLSGRPAHEPRVPAARPLGWGRLCGNPRCGHVNPDAARYCARCGRSLNAGFGDPDHG